MRDRRGQSGISGYRVAVSLSHGQEDRKGGKGTGRFLQDKSGYRVKDRDVATFQTNVYIIDNKRVCQYLGNRRCLLTRFLSLCVCYFCAINQNDFNIKDCSDIIIVVITSRFFIFLDFIFLFVAFLYFYNKYDYFYYFTLHDIHTEDVTAKYTNLVREIF